MKLYYSPGACSLSPHIVLREAGIKFDLEKVDLKSHKTASGEDFEKINPKGYVPALQLDNGEVITEGAAIVQYVADLNPGAELAPAPGTLARVRLQEHLNFIAAELHKNFTPIFSPDASDAVKDNALKTVIRRLGYIEQVLNDKRHYLLGDVFSAADAYLFVILLWAKFKNINTDALPNVSAFFARAAGRAKVQEALKAEGLA